MDFEYYQLSPDLEDGVITLEAHSNPCQFSGTDERNGNIKLTTKLITTLT